MALGLAWVVSLAWAWSAQAAVLSGIVTAHDTGLHAPGVVIKLTIQGETGASYATISGEDGSFSFTGLRPSHGTLEAKSIGYRPKRQDVSIADDTTHVTLRLQPRPLVMDELVVRATRDSVGLLHSPAFVESIPLRQAAPGADLSSVLDAATGINVRRNGGLGSFATVSIRGSTAAQVLVFLDGVPLNQAQGGGVNIGEIPLGGVESVDVYRGAVPGRFGGNSIGGVVHIRTRRIAHKRQADLRLTTGSFGTYSGTASASSPWRVWQLMGLVEFNRSRNDFRFWDDNGTEYNRSDDSWANRRNSDFRSVRTLCKASRPVGQGQVQIHGTLDVSKTGIPGISANQALHARLDGARQVIEAVLYGPLAGRSGYRLKVFHVDHETEFRDPHGEIGIGGQHSRNDTRALGLRGELNTLIGEGLLTAFAEAKREDFDPENLLQSEARMQDSRRRSLTGGLEAEIPLSLGGRSLTLNGSVQSEYLDDRFFGPTTFDFSPSAPTRDKGRGLWGTSVGGSLDLGRGWSIRGHRARYERAPSFFELFGDRGNVVGNTDLTPEQSNNWDVGLTHHSSSLSARTEIVYYRNHVDHLIRFVQNSQWVSRPHNIGEAILQGLETRIQMRPFDALSLNGNYVYQHAENRSPLLHERGNDLPNAPRHRANARITWTVGAASFSYELSRESRHFLDRANLRSVDDHVQSTASSALTLGTSSIAIEMRNVTDARVADLWGYPLPGRAVFLSVRHELSR